MSEDPFRADAALVYRHLRDVGPSTAVELAVALFPVAESGPASTIVALQTRSMRRVFDSIVWMRHRGVVISAVPGPLSVFHLGHVAVDPKSVVPVRSVGVLVAEESEDPISALDVWHGG